MLWDRQSPPPPQAVAVSVAVAAAGTAERSTNATGRSARDSASTKTQRTRESVAGRACAAQSSIQSPWQACLARRTERKTALSAANSQELERDTELIAWVPHRNGQCFVVECVSALQGIAEIRIVGGAALIELVLVLVFVFVCVVNHNDVPRDALGLLSMMIELAQQMRPLLADFVVRLPRRILLILALPFDEVLQVLIFIVSFFQDPFRLVGKHRADGLRAWSADMGGKPADRPCLTDLPRLWSDTPSCKLGF